MRIGCVQFAPRLGKVSENIDRVDALLSSSPQVEKLDFLVLPELALTGPCFFDLISWDQSLTLHMYPNQATIFPPWKL